MDPKPSKEEGKTLITHCECQQELEKSKIKVALIKEDEFKKEIDAGDWLRKLFKLPLWC